MSIQKRMNRWLIHLFSLLAFFFHSNLIAADWSQSYLMMHGGLSAPAGYYKQFFNQGLTFNISWDNFYRWQWLRLASDFSFTRYNYTFNTQSNLNQMSLWLTPYYMWEVNSYFNLYSGLGLGVNYLSLNLVDTNVSSSTVKPAMRVVLGNRFQFTKYWGMNLALNYQFNQLSKDWLQSYSVQLGTYLHIGSIVPFMVQKKPDIKIVRKSPKQIFAAHVPYFNKHGVGEIVLRNTSNVPIHNIKIESNLNDPIADTSQSTTVNVLQPGKMITISLPLHMTQKVYQIEEVQDYIMQLKIVYEKKNEQIILQETIPIKIYSKNSILWDDLNKIGSFVTPRENVISTFTRNMLSQVPEDKFSNLNEVLRNSMILLQGLKSQGIVYVSDPKNNFLSDNNNQTALDYLMFARETLIKRGGDCDDLSVLYSSMLESVGIETAMATVPGHILVLINTGVTPWNYLEVTANKKMLYMHNDIVWLPIEVTALQSGFNQAWQKGVEVIHKSQNHGLQVLPVKKAWLKYKPAALDRGSPVVVSKIHLQDILRELSRYRLTHFMSKYKIQLSKLEKNPTPGNQNRIAVLLVQMNQRKKARTYFSALIQKSPDYYPGLVNLGNLYLLQGDKDKALEVYSKALSVNHRGHEAVIALAMLNHNLGKKKIAKHYYQQAIELRPMYKNHYAFILDEEKMRSSQDSIRIGKIQWIY